jgi:hypothetical protein
MRGANEKVEYGIGNALCGAALSLTLTPQLSCCGGS